MTWTFHLRENVKFHDGRALTAGDFVKTFERAKELGNVAGDLLDSVEEVKAEDDHTLVLELSETTGLLLHNLSQGWLMPISVKSLEEMGEDKFSRQPVSVGPWEVEKWQSGQQITLSRFEDYNWAPTWFENQGPPYPEELVMKFIPEEETRIAALRAGEINLAELPSKYVDDFEEMDDFSLGQILRRGLGLYLFFNFKKETLAQLEVRKAINHALQRSSI
ncbi:MAG: ABC transporter substrate-binding protein, partial [Candidatus Bipolaricaulota bacterium]